MLSEKCHCVDGMFKRDLLAESWEMIWRGQEGPRARLLDLFLLVFLIGGGSWFFDRDFGGWVRANPSPFFLVPILMGGKYGQSAGVVAGAFCAALLAGLAVYFNGLDFVEVAEARKVFLVAFPLVGLLCGEVRGALYQEAARSGIQFKLASQRMRALDEQVFILGEAKDELDRELVLMNADSANLDYEIRRVLQSSPERFYEALLGVFCRKGRLYEAAIYTKGEPWKREAFAGVEADWPEKFDIGSSPVVGKAMANCKIATLPEMWESSPSEVNDYLLACPIGDDVEPNGVLVVKTMDFFAMNARGVQTIQIIAQWVSEFSGMGKKARGFFDPRGLVPIGDFGRMLELACLVQRNFRLISSVILFRAKGGEGGTSEDILKSVKGAVRLGDTLSTMEGKPAHIVMLLPLTGKRGAEICAARFREFAGSQEGKVALVGDIFCTNDHPKKEAMLAAILKELDEP